MLYTIVNSQKTKYNAVTVQLLVLIEIVKAGFKKTLISYCVLQPPCHVPEAAGEEGRVAAGLEDPEDQGEGEEQLPRLQEAEAAVQDQNHAHQPDAQIQGFLNISNNFRGAKPCRLL